jgi:hypothetical protein
MVVAEALDCPGAVSQVFDLPDARLMIAGAMEDLAELSLEEGKRRRFPSVKRHELIDPLARHGCYLTR